jgi:hypothetical protein
MRVCLLRIKRLDEYYGHCLKAQPGLFFLLRQFLALYLCRVFIRMNTEIFTFYTKNVLSQKQFLTTHPKPLVKGLLKKWRFGSS